MEALMEAVGRPHERVPAFHVAGTNGKGSTTAVLAALLRAGGRRVAVYTSPHLVDFRERFVIDGVAITEDDVTDWIRRRTPLVERLNATFFEATTAMAFELFAKADVDTAVIEVGLGGRLDATNVITPVVAGVASIGIDHVEFLGTTLEEIAREKAGIFKAGRPAVIGEPAPAVRGLLAECAREAGATPVTVVAESYAIGDVRVDPGDGTTFTLNGRALRTGLAGAHQALNAALAIAMVDAAGAEYAMASERVAAALAGVRLPGRFQRVGRYIFDVAHNPDGAGVLAATMRAVGPAAPVVAVLSVLNDKDWRGVMTAVAGVVDHFVLTNAPTAPAARAWHLDEAFAFASSHGWRATMVPDFGRALVLASEMVVREGEDETQGGTVLVTGSFHTVGDAMASLQLSPLAA
jgi:dihydrofolate synthase / folylpolyglutamate synthase